MSHPLSVFVNSFSRHHLHITTILPLCHSHQNSNDEIIKAILITILPAPSRLSLSAETCQRTTLTQLSVTSNHFLHESLHFSALLFCKRWGSLWLEVSDFYYLSLVLTNHNYLSKILSRSSITRVPVEISFEVLNFVSLHIFASAIVLSLWRTLLFFSIIVFSVTFLSINER